MNNQEAGQLLFMLQSLDPYAKKRDEDETFAIAVQIASILPTTPLIWAQKHVHACVRAGSVPKITDIADAWKAEARRRVESVPVPPAPPEIEADPARWQMWERARRDALIAGASPEQAFARASRQIGGTTLRQIEAPVSHERAQDAKQQVLAFVKAWSAQQRAAQQDTNDQTPINRGEGQ